MHLQIEYKETAKLIPYVNNSRTHSDEQIKQVASSIKEFGFTNPILIDETDGIIAGHGRLMAAQLLDMQEVPTIRLVGLTKAQTKAYVIADNQLALNSGWDLDRLKLEVLDLDDLSFNLETLGFDDKFLTDLIDPLTNEVELREESYSQVFNIVVNCDDEPHQERIFNELDEKGYKCQVQSL